MVQQAIKRPQKKTYKQDPFIDAYRRVAGSSDYSFKNTPPLRDDIANTTILDSEWLTIISYYKEDIDNPSYTAVIFFDFIATASPKNPLGFGPNWFYNVPLTKIRAMEKAASAGRQYLKYWAFANKDTAYLKRIARSKTYEKKRVAKYNEELYKRRALLKQRVNEADTTTITKEDMEKFRELDNFLYTANQDQEFWEKLHKIEANQKLNSHGGKRAGAGRKSSGIEKPEKQLIDISFGFDNGEWDAFYIAKNLLTYIEDIFAINIEKKVKYRLLSQFLPDIINPSRIIQFKYFYREIGNILDSGDVINGAGKLFKKYGTYKLRALNPLFSGEGGRERYILYNEMKDHLKEYLSDRQIKNDLIRQNSGNIDFYTGKWRQNETFLAEKFRVTGKSGIKRLDRRPYFVRVAKKGVRIAKAILLW